MDLVGDLDYDAQRVVLSDLGSDSGQNSPLDRECSTPRSTLTLSPSERNLAPDSPGPYHYAGWSVTQGSELPDLPNSDVLAKSSASQPTLDADRDDSLQPGSFGEGTPPFKPAYRQLQLSTPPPDWPYFKAGVDWNAATQVVDPPSLSAVETAAGSHISDGPYKSNGSTVTPPALSTRQSDQVIYECPLGLRDQRLPVSSFPEDPSVRRYVRSKPIVECRRKKKLPTGRTPSTCLDGVADKKKTHNAVERRYRQNINSKIAALRDSVPALRAMSQGNLGSDGEIGDDAFAPSPTYTLNKATVLLGAIDYIRQLERRNRQLRRQCEVQKARIDAIEKLYAEGGIGNASGGMGTRICPPEFRLGDS